MQWTISLLLSIYISETSHILRALLAALLYKVIKGGGGLFIHREITTCLTV